MKVVINSSPLIALGCIGKIDILTDIFEEVFIPQEVFNETVVNGKNDIVLEGIKKNDKLTVISATNIVLIEFLSDNLDKGESEVIAIAKENKIETVIIDELKGRKIAGMHGLNVIGSLGILSIAKKKGFIDEVKKYIDEMEQYGIRIGTELKRHILGLCNE